MSRRVLAVATAMAATAAAVSSAQAARAPTYVEKATIMDAFNVPGRAFPSACVRIVVSTVDPRYAMLTSPRVIPKACSKAGAVGDGYVVFRRATPTALRWKDIFEGSSGAPCSLPAAVRKDLLGSSSCG
jgi:hypothetical protein